MSQFDRSRAKIQRNNSQFEIMKHPLLAFAVACILVLVAAGFRSVVGAEPGEFVFLPLLMPIAAGAWLGGFRLGALVTIIGGAVFWYFYLLPEHSFIIERRIDVVALITFLATGFFVSGIVRQAQLSGETQIERDLLW